MDGQTESALVDHFHKRDGIRPRTPASVVVGIPPLGLEGLCVIPTVDTAPRRRQAFCEGAGVAGAVNQSMRKLRRMNNGSHKGSPRRCHAQRKDRCPSNMTGQMDGLLDFAFFWSSPFLPTIVRLQPGLRSFYNGIRGLCIISPPSSVSSSRSSMRLSIPIPSASRKYLRTEILRRRPCLM